MSIQNSTIKICVDESNAPMHLFTNRILWILASCLSIFCNLLLHLPGLLLAFPLLLLPSLALDIPLHVDAVDLLRGGVAHGQPHAFAPSTSSNALEPRRVGLGVMHLTLVAVAYEAWGIKLKQKQSQNTSAYCMRHNTRKFTNATTMSGHSGKCMLSTIHACVSFNWFSYLPSSFVLSLPPLSCAPPQLLASHSSASWQSQTQWASWNEKLASYPPVPGC